jgi:hypothetical protein
MSGTVRVSRVQDQARRRPHAAAGKQGQKRCPAGIALCVSPGEVDPKLHGSDSPADAAHSPGKHLGVDKPGQSRRAWLGPPLQAGPRPKALPPTRWLAGAAYLVASVQEMAVLRLEDAAEPLALRRARAGQPCWADTFHSRSEDCVFVKAGCGKSARPDVRPAKAGMFSRRQTCRGKSQGPVVWIAEVMETETLKPIDTVSPGEATSHRAVTKVNALWPRK